MYVLVIRFAFIIQQLNKMLCLILGDSRGFDGCDICRKKLIIRRKKLYFLYMHIISKYKCNYIPKINKVIQIK